MSVAKVIEISSESKKSFDDAISDGLKKASKTVKNIKSAWIKDQQVELKNGEIDCYRVHMSVTFVLD